LQGVAPCVNWKIDFHKLRFTRELQNKVLHCGNITIIMHCALKTLSIPQSAVPTAPFVQGSINERV